jgi:hypothetical protein
MIAYAASNIFRRADKRDTRWDIDFQWLRNDGDAHFSTSRNVPASFGERPSVSKPGTDSRRYDDGCGVAGLGHARSKDPRQHGWSCHRNVALFTLSDTSQLRRPVLLRTIRLVVHPTKVSLRLQRRHFFKRQSCILSIRAAATTVVTGCSWLVRSSVAMILRLNARFGLPTS